MNAQGAPVFGRSSETLVPIGDSKVGPNGILPDFAADVYPLLDSVRRWVAPFGGTIRISGPVKLLPAMVR